VAGLRRARAGIRASVARKGGWTRVGARRHFRYLDGRGKRITDSAKLERIQELAIPPAWKEVWISPRPTAKLQATGVDAAGRRQYLYHEDYRAAQEEAKFHKLVRFADALPAFREAMSKHIELAPMAPEWTCAVAVRLINLGWFRVGDDRYVKAHKTFGITTLRRSHVRVRGSRIAFRFRAKHRIWVRTAVVDTELAQAMRELLDTRGSRLFRYRLEDEIYNLSARAERLHRRVHGRGIHCQGFPYVGRHAGRGGRACGAPACGDRDGGQAHGRGGDENRRRAARQYAGGCARFLRQSRRRRAVSGGANDR
jgi:DNA topoisomerase IB